MDENTIEEHVEAEAAEAGADAGAIAAAIVAEPAAAEAAREAVEPVVEEVRDLVHRAEDAIEQTEDDRQWERINTTLLEMENRIVQGVTSAIAPLVIATSSESTSSTTPPEVIAEHAEQIEDAAEQLAEEVEGATTTPDGEAIFDPLAVESAAEEAASGKRRVRGVRRRRG